MVPRFANIILWDYLFYPFWKKFPLSGNSEVGSYFIELFASLVAGVDFLEKQLRIHGEDVREEATYCVQASTTFKFVLSRF